MSTLFLGNRLTIFERVKKNSVHGTWTLHFSENLIFSGYLCEICSMCENMAICVKI
jgi:hypothetical protein